MANAALKEMRYAFTVFEPYRVGAQGRDLRFGAHAPRRSAVPPDRRASRASSPTVDWMVITGAGPGIMEAGIEGAGAANSFGVSIRLPFEAATTQFLADDPKLVNFRYFFTRKVTFVKEAHAFVLLPGGFGTLDEAFELLTLVQTGKSVPAPIVLLDVPGGTYWQSWTAFVRARAPGPALHLARRPRARSDHRRRARRARRDHRLLPQLPLAAIRRRRPRAADEDAARPTPRSPRSTTTSPTSSRAARSSRCPTSKAEIADHDVPDLARLRMRFDRHSYARLHVLIKRLERDRRAGSPIGRRSRRRRAGSRRRAR